MRANMFFPQTYTSQNCQWYCPVWWSLQSLCFQGLLAMPLQWRNLIYHMLVRRWR